VALEFAEARYHLDIAFCPLAFGEVMYYRGAFTDAARGAIDERVTRAQQIILNEHDAAVLRRIRSHLVARFCFELLGRTAS
jgi:N-dimethylarginine dimethylaminohydrolase